MRREQPLKDLLLRHCATYPEMQVQDIIKLIYQNEFAGGHLIVNEEASLCRIREETSRYEDGRASGGTPEETFEDIGNGLCRIHLSSITQGGTDQATVNRLFINTANSAKGSIESFEGKLDLLRRCCLEGALPFSTVDLEEYLESYRRQGYPPVSHSERYRRAYKPAYRVIRSEYCDFYEVFSRIDTLMKSQDNVIAAIDGNSGAGKSTLASLIAGVYDCNVFHMDDFFLTPGLRTEERLDEPGGNVDYERFRQEVMAGLQNGKEFYYKAYDCRSKTMGMPARVQPKRLNIVEGSYSMHPTLEHSYDLKIFLQIDENEQRFRILKRNGSPMLERFICEWIPLENKYFRELKIKQRCDLVFYS